MRVPHLQSVCQLCVGEFEGRKSYAESGVSPFACSECYDLGYVIQHVPGGSYKGTTTGIVGYQWVPSPMASEDPYNSGHQEPVYGDVAYEGYREPHDTYRPCTCPTGLEWAGQSHFRKQTGLRPFVLAMLVLLLLIAILLLAPHL